MEFFDPDRIARLIRDLGPDTMVEFLQMLPGELAGLQADLARGIETADPALVARTRHTIKGMADSIGAAQMSLLVGTIGKQGLENGAQQLAAFMVCVAGTCREAEELILQLQSEPRRLSAAP